MYSILIHTNNNDQNFCSMLETVCLQTYRPIQCIIPNSVKSDEIQSIADTNAIDLVYVSDHENRIKYWNNAISYANGDYIQCLDINDKFVGTNCISTIVNFMQKQNTEWIACSVICSNTNELHVPVWNNNILQSNTLYGISSIVFKNELKYIMLDDKCASLCDVEWYYRIYKIYGPPLFLETPMIYTIIEKHNTGDYSYIYEKHGISIDNRLKDISPANRWDFIDKIVYMNLDSRIDRRNHMEEFTKTFKNKVVRFSAVQHSVGRVGCAMSHIQVLKDALKSDCKNILILEDDAEWNKFDDSYVCLQRLIQNPYDVILLGGSAIRSYSNNRVDYSQTAASYLVNGHYISTLLHNFEESFEKNIHEGPTHNNAMDIYWKKLQKTDNWYITHPVYIYQKPSYSNIENRNVDYRSEMLNIDIIDAVKK
jgi:glycosyl transferase, family 25